MSANHAFFATAPRGLEALVADELGALGLDSVEQQRGGVAFRSTLEGAYRACLWSRVANRVLLPLIEFEAGDESALYEGSRAVEWSEHFGPGETLAVEFTGIRPALRHSRFAAQRVKDAIVDQMRETLGERPSVDLRQPDIRIHAHMNGHRVSLALDLSGESLHRRGYRMAGNPAPLKENLAAAMLMRADWPALAAAGGGLVDPMTGSGTLLIEAALMAGDIAPGLLRTHYGFMHWRGHDAARWKSLIDEALEREEIGRKRLPPLVGSDHDRAAVRLAQANIQRAGLADSARIDLCELTRARPPARCDSGLFVANPPYGERLGQAHELLPLYLRLGQTLKQYFPGWRAVILNGAACEIGLKPDRSWQLFNGALECRLERFEIAAESNRQQEIPAQDLVNRIQKNRRRLKKWRTREEVTCYRAYDADIPEYALAVDLYGTESGEWLHVQEYAAPSGVDETAARARLRAALTALPEALEIDPQRMVFKVRQRQRGKAQYRQLDRQDRWLTVREGACRLAVNLTDHLDTGLFLDHRTVRRWLFENARGRRLLNLFCYTGTATVQAAMGGARNTTSVDLSNTYLDALRRNLALNDIDEKRHRILRADALDWLQRCDERFELIFLDPPSFSNSKKMETSLDLQRDHPSLIDAAMRCLAREGTLVFSTNLRRFRMDPRLLRTYRIEDRSAWSIPKDFERNRNIHSCYFIRHPSDGDSP